MASVRTSIGIFVDGQELKLARLALKRGAVVLEELESQHLDVKLEEQHQMTEATMDLPGTGGAAGGAGESGEFGVPAPSEQVIAEPSGGDNYSIILGLLSKYPPGKYMVSYAIGEPSLYYHTFESDFGLKGKKLRQRILEEIRSIRGSEPAEDAIDYFYSADRNLVAVIREGGMSLLNLLDSIKQFIGKRLPKLPLIESADVALLNLARSNFGFGPEEYTAIIYVGIEFTRIIFMKGAEFFHFAPSLGEGFDSSNIRNTVYSRLLLEQDNVGIPKVDRILLAGEAHKVGFDEFIHEQLPEVEVQYLSTPYLDTTELTAEMQEQVPEFAIAIATAWKALDEEHPGFYGVNLVPAYVKESQRAFKLAWHGYILLLMIFLSTFYFTSRFTQSKSDVRKRESTLSQLKVHQDENKRLQQAIASLNDQINKYNVALAVYDSMAPGANHWSRIVEQLAKGADDLRDVWIDEMKSNPDGGMSLKGYALSRGRIPRIAALFDNATLAKVEVKPIREKTPSVYYFEITVPPQPQRDTTSAPRPQEAK